MRVGGENDTTRTAKKIVTTYNVMVCVCDCVFVRVCCFPIFSGRQACGRTSRSGTGGRSHRISHAPSFCGACLKFSREKDSAVPSLVNREVEFCVLTN